MDALRHSPRWIRDLLRFAYGNHEIALKTGPMNIGPSITPQAFVENRRMESFAVELSCTDLLATGCPKLLRLFAVGGHATLTEKRRHELWADIVSRLPEDEAVLMESIRRTRTLPGDSSASPPSWCRRRSPDCWRPPCRRTPPRSPTRRFPDCWDRSRARTAVAGAPMVDDGQPGGIETVSDLDRWLHGERDREEERRRYEKVYSRMIFPL